MKIGGLVVQDKDLLVLGGVVGLLVLFGPHITRAIGKQIALSAGGAASGIVEGAGEAVTEVVMETGEVVGVPRTNKTQCQQDIDAGRTWDASFSCPAGTFLSYINPF